VRWIRDLLALGLLPKIEILEETDSTSWPEAERRIIADIRSRNGRLTNAAAGGDGVDMPRTPEWAAKIGAAHRGKIVAESVREVLRDQNLARHDAGCVHGHPWTPENTIMARARKRDGSPRYIRTCRTCRSEQHKRWYDTHRRSPRLPTLSCENGHPRTPENTYTSPKGQSYCVPCSRERSRQYKRRVRAAVPPRTLCHKGLHPITEENTRRFTVKGKEGRGCRLCFEARTERDRPKRLEQERERRRIKREAGIRPAHCKRGHLYTNETSILTSHGVRRCLICIRKSRKGEQLPLAHRVSK
jgi:hypothetical protein